MCNIVIKSQKKNSISKMTILDLGFLIRSHLSHYARYGKFDDESLNGRNKKNNVAIKKTNITLVRKKIEDSLSLLEM